MTASELTGSSDVFAGNGSGVASLDQAIKTLHDAEEKVKVIISRRFDEAVEVSRLKLDCESKFSTEISFLKLTPLSKCGVEEKAKI